MTHVKSIEEIRLILSEERCARYLAWAGGCPNQALELYNLNTALSEALYTPLQALELALRNQIHAVMTKANGDQWFRQAGALLVEQQAEQLVQAEEELTRQGKDLTPGRIIAALSFSFWTAMLSPTYEELWRSTLHQIATAPGGKRLDRKKLMRPLTQIRTLRNRVAHHEPILHWDLPRHHGAIRELISCLSNAAMAWCDCLSRFPAVFPTGGYKLVLAAPAT